MSRRTGTVMVYDPAKGSGLIVDDESKKQYVYIYGSISSPNKTLTVGEKVTFILISDRRYKLVADDIKHLNE